MLDRVLGGNASKRTSSSESHVADGTGIADKSNMFGLKEEDSASEVAHNPQGMVKPNVEDVYIGRFNCAPSLNRSMAKPFPFHLQRKTFYTMDIENI